MGPIKKITRTNFPTQKKLPEQYLSYFKVFLSRNRSRKFQPRFSYYEFTVRTQPVPITSHFPFLISHQIFRRISRVKFPQSISSNHKAIQRNKDEPSLLMLKQIFWTKRIHVEIKSLTMEVRSVFETLSNMWHGAFYENSFNGWNPLIFFGKHSILHVW